jgi:anti-anti-sigma factor
MNHPTELNETRGTLSTSVLAGRWPREQVGCVLYLNSPLRAPRSGALRHGVKDLLRRGEREIVLDLARVRSIDGAGVGQLVRVYNLTRAADGVLRIVHATPWVREILERVALFALLTGGGDRDLDRKRFKRLQTDAIGEAADGRCAP